MRVNMHSACMYACMQACMYLWMHVCMWVSISHLGVSGYSADTFFVRGLVILGLPWRQAKNPALSIRLSVRIGSIRALTRRGPLLSQERVNDGNQTEALASLYGSFLQRCEYFTHRGSKAIWHVSSYVSGLLRRTQLPCGMLTKLWWRPGILPTETPVARAWPFHLLQRVLLTDPK